MLLVLIFLVGLCVGSFLGVIIDRLPVGKTIWKGRSHCDHCKKPLEWYELIPLLSFVLQNGKCRKCKTKLSFKYPFIELLTGLLFVSVFLWLQTSSTYIFSLVYYLFIVSSLIIIFFIDLKHKIIPDLIVFPAIFVSFLYILLNTSYMLQNYFLSALGAFLFFLLLFLVTRGRGMGLGDVKFAFLMGLVLGFPDIITALYAAFLTGAFVSMILIVGRKAVLKSAVPFGPFLVVGVFFALFWGDYFSLYILEMVHGTNYILRYGF